MQVCEFALGILESPEVDKKLRPPPTPLLDQECGSFVPDWPAREDRLSIVSARETRVPKLHGWPEAQQRRRILHALANHELQAVELYAWAVLRFGEAPSAFRQDLVRILLEEQRHARGYIERLEEMGGRFGEYPVSGYFWRKVELMNTPLRFVSAMSLTFENANLDHSLESRRVALEAGDREAAKLFRVVHEDEIGHVHFGWKWLSRLKEPEQSCWDAYCSHLLPPLHPGRASGRNFHPEPRQSAGLDQEFIVQLKNAHLEKQQEHGRANTRAG